MRKVLKAASFIGIQILLASLCINQASATTSNFNCGTSGTYQVDDATHTITGHTACVGALNIDSSVTAIGNNAFQNNQSLTDVTIPASVTSIGSSAFNNAYMNSLTLNEGLVTIGGSAFANVYTRGNTVTISFPNSVTTIGSSAFSQAYFKGFSVGENVTTIGDSAFYNNFSQGSRNTVFRGVSGVTSIANYTFIGYQGTELVLPPNITSIGQRPFESSPNLRYFIIPSGVTTMAADVFKNMSGLNTLIFPDALSTIGTNAFTGTTNLRTVLYCGSSSAVQNYTYPNSIVPVCAKGVIFNNNGGSGTMATETGTSTMALTANTFTKSGSLFSGWNTKADGTGTNYGNGDNYDFTSSIVLYAKWTAISTPGAPSIGTATSSGSTTADVTFTAPASNGGATIDYYQCVSSPSSSTVTLNQSGSGTCSFSGLTTNTSYQFSVRAHNVAGFSAYSSQSSAITVGAVSQASDDQAKAKEAERLNQERIRLAREALILKAKSNEVIIATDLSNADFAVNKKNSVDLINKEISELNAVQKEDFNTLSKVVSKYQTYEVLASETPQKLNAKELINVGILPPETPQPNYILSRIQALPSDQRDTVEKVAQLVKEKTDEYNARKAHLAAVLKRG